MRNTEADALIERVDAPATPVLRGKNAERASIRDHMPRIGHIWLFLLFTTVFTFNSNYVGSELNQMKMILTIKMDWGIETNK